MKLVDDFLIDFKYMPQIVVDKGLCTRCNTCSIVCVTKIIENGEGSDYPMIPEDKLDYCIKCGHCESFCPERALTLDYLTNEKLVSTIDDASIEPNRLALYVKNRRSVRHFTSAKVSKEVVSQIIDIARYAASGGNSQPVKWIVIHDPVKVTRIASLTIDWMRTILNTDHPLAPYVSGIITMWDSGVDLICHNAPHMLFTHIPEEHIDDPTEAVIAMTHFDIVAPSFGVGTCWAGFVKMALDGYQPLRDLISLPEGRKAACPMLFGFSKFKVNSVPRRNPAEIRFY